MPLRGLQGGPLFGTTSPRRRCRTPQLRKEFATCGFLGLGGKLVAIPDGKFTRTGADIQLGMTAGEVSKLPEVKDQG
jgi:hypothetical protein